MAHDVFISYSNKDKTTADAICNYLESNEIRCWYAPRDITPGDEWGVAILEAIKQSKIMVLVFTENANLSQQVLREVNNAVDAELAIIPFRLTEQEPVAGMKYYLSTVHWMDAMNEELEESLPRLHDLCRAILDKKPVPAGSASSAQSATGRKEGNKTLLIAGIAALALAAAGGAFVMGGAGKGSNTSSNPSGAKATVVEKAGSGDSGASVIEHTEDSKPRLKYDIGAVTEGLSEDPAETYTKGNTQANLQNGGHLAYDGTWYYYTSNDGGKMYRMKGDGSQKTKLTDVGTAAISIYNDYVYFYNTDDYSMMRMKPDGSELTTIYDDGSESLRIVGDRIYFGDVGISSVNLDGGDFREENSIKGYNYTFDGTYIYYSESGSNYLMRAKMDGSDATCILDHSCLSLTIAGNRLFFYDNDTGYYSFYDLSTGEVTQLTTDSMNSATITASGVYGSNGRGALAFLPFDSVGTKILVNDWTSETGVCGEKVFYLNETEDAYYIMNLDGSSNEKL